MKKVVIPVILLVSLCSYIKIRFWQVLKTLNIVHDFSEHRISAAVLNNIIYNPESNNCEEVVRRENQLIFYLK